MDSCTRRLAIIIVMSLTLTVFAPLRPAQASFLTSCRDKMSGKLDRKKGPLPDLTLSKSKLKALKNAAQGDFSVNVVTKNINGQQKSIVFLGEAHVKTPENSARGKDVLKTFKVAAIEGFDVSKLWGAKFMNLVLGRMLNKKARLEDVDQTQDEADDDGVEQDGQAETEGSTIDDAYRIAARTNPDFIKALIDQGVEKMTPDELSKKVFPFDYANRVVFSGEEALAIVKNAKKYKGHPPHALEIVPIEYDRKPELGENLASVYLPALGLTCIGVMCSYLLPHASDVVKHGFLYSFGGLALYLRGDLFAIKHIPRTPLLFFSMGPQTGLIRWRNRDMAEILEDFLIESKEKQILVIVGRTHVPGVINLLEQQDFQEVPLENIKAVK